MFSGDIKIQHCENLRYEQFCLAIANLVMYDSVTSFLLTLLFSYGYVLNSSVICLRQTTSTLHEKSECVYSEEIF